jgi:acetylornithine deacetylase/succinyl-diaminopimelate desuccinylase-like protein
MDYSQIDAMIDQDRIVDFFKSIVRIPSNRFEEENVARHIGTYMNGMGMTVSYQKVRQKELETVNVIGRFGPNKGGKRIVLCAHMDTGSGQYQGLVFQPEKWTKKPLDPVVEDGYFYGLGTHNDKQGVCCMVMAADAVIKSGVPIDGEIIIAAVAAETVGGVGAGHLVRDGLKADVGVILEGTGLDIVPISVGKIRGRIFVKGEHQHHTAHVNPVEQLRHLLEAFSPGYAKNRAQSFLTTKLSEPELPGVPSAAIRWIHSDNLDLDRVGAYFDVMVLHDQTPDSVKKDLERLIDAIRKEHPEFDAEVEVSGWEPPASENFIWGAPGTPTDSDIVQRVASHHEAVRKERPVIGAGKRFGAASDAASLRRAGIRTIEYAPGSIGPGGELKSWPAIDERVRLKDVVDCTRILARAIADLTNEPREAKR